MSSNEPLIRVYVSPSTVNEWRECEVASWEDQQAAREGAGHPDNVVPVGEHVVEIIDGQTRTTVLYLTVKQARIAIESLDYQGSGGLWDERSGSWTRAIDRIAKELQKGIDALDVTIYQEPHKDISLDLIKEVARTFPSFHGVRVEPDQIVVMFNSEADAENYVCKCDGDERFLTPAYVP